MSAQRLERMDQKIDQLIQETSLITAILARNTSDLEYHVKRTELAETSLDTLREEIKALTKFKSMFDGALKTLGVIGTIVGLVIGGAKLFFGN